MANTYPPLINNNPPKNSSLFYKIFFLFLSLAAIIGTICYFSGKDQIFIKSSSSNSNNIPLSLVCANAPEPKPCLSSLSEVVPSNGALVKNDLTPLKSFLNTSVVRLEGAIKIANDASRRIDGQDIEALGVCVELMDVSMDRIMGSIRVLSDVTLGSYHDVHTWLSSVLTDYVTCLDGLSGPARSLMGTRLDDLIARAQASLALFVAIKPTKNEPMSFNRKYPSWVTIRDRKLLGALPNEITADVVVAKDGSGKYTNVSEAVANAPDKSTTRYVIYIKTGIYEENIDVGKKKKNLMFIGDGVDATIITGSLNYVDGTSTFRTATVAVNGDGFMAQDISFQNTAGPEKHQAVALRVSADQVVINRCRIDAYQDTLYAHKLRQFYRDCQVTGTVDFIFGNAAAVLQNCKIIARKPLDKQKNMVTAQSREDPNQNTALSLQYCEVISSSDLKPVIASFKTYLGRPWKPYSRTVVMQSYIEDHIDPTGWSKWDDNTDVTLMYYGEYKNNGPGANTSNRVDWPGFHVIESTTEARSFTVGELIQGGVWLEPTGVTYNEGL